MGHTIVERLPLTARWQVVVGLLATSDLRADRVADATTRAAQKRLRMLRDDPSLVTCFWLLVRLASAARDREFAAEANRLGIAVGADDSVQQFIARVADTTRIALNRYPESGPFGEIAALALRTALRETVGTEGRSLFGTPLDDLEAAFRRHASEVQFGDLARRFFADYVRRMLRYYVDRELPRAAGHAALPGIRDTSEFGSALDLHARQRAKAVELYAAQWYGKKRWERLGDIGLEDAADFVAHALEKLEYALKLGAAR